MMTLTELQAAATGYTDEQRRELQAKYIHMLDNENPALEDNLEEIKMEWTKMPVSKQFEKLEKTVLDAYEGSEG